jgi:hypothetical protein
MTPIPRVRLLYHDRQFFLPEEFQGHPPDRLASTPGDNLGEFSGRVAYASLMKPRGRPTPDYHAHIRETKHHSVYANVVETFEVTYGPGAVIHDAGNFVTAWGHAVALHGRPGVWVTFVDHGRLRFAISLRAVIEWAEHGLADHYAVQYARDDVYSDVLAALTLLYPLTLAGLTAPPCARPRTSVTRLTPAKKAQERWCSVYVTGVSRDVLGELVRHHYQANPSVQSTRYVDLSNGPQILHPALEPHPALVACATSYGTGCRLAYKVIYDGLVKEGVDLKTARGAARSVLPGATETKLVFSLSEFQARHILSLRLKQSTGSADPEIVRFAELLAAALEPVWGDLTKA